MRSRVHHLFAYGDGLAFGVSVDRDWYAGDLLHPQCPAPKVREVAVEKFTFASHMTREWNVTNKVAILRDIARADLLLRT